MFVNVSAISRPVGHGCVGSGSNRTGSLLVVFDLVFALQVIVALLPLGLRHHA